MPEPAGRRQAAHLFCTTSEQASVSSLQALGRIWVPCMVRGLGEKRVRGGVMKGGGPAGHAWRCCGMPRQSIGARAYASIGLETSSHDRSWQLKD